MDFNPDFLGQMSNTSLCCHVLHYALCCDINRLHSNTGVQTGGGGAAAHTGLLQGVTCGSTPSKSELEFVFVSSMVRLPQGFLASNRAISKLRDHKGFLSPNHSGFLLM